MDDQLGFDFAVSTDTHVSETAPALGSLAAAELAVLTASDVFHEWTAFFDKKFSRRECSELVFAELLTYLLFLKLDHERGQIAERHPRLARSSRAVIRPELGWASIMDKTGEELLRQFKFILGQLQIPDESLPQEQRPLTTTMSVFAGARLPDDSHITEVTRLIRDLVGTQPRWSDHREALSGAYEKLLFWCAPVIDQNRNAGQVLTPRPLLAAIAEVLEITSGDIVFDPAAGSGGSLLAAHRRALSTGGLGADALVGADDGQTIVRLGSMNVLLATGRPFGDLAPITKADAMAREGAVIHRPDGSPLPTVVICNPPFRDVERSQRPEHRDDLKASRHTPANFVQHIAQGMPIGARAAVFLPDATLTNSHAKTILSALIPSCDVHTLLRLPRGVFRNGADISGVHSNVLFFTKLGPRPDGQPVSGPLWVYSARHRDPETVLAPGGLEDFIGRARLSGRLERIPSESFSEHSPEELAERGYQLHQLGASDEALAADHRPPGEIARDIVEQLALAQKAFDEIASQFPVAPSGTPA